MPAPVDRTFGAIAHPPVGDLVAHVETFAFYESANFRHRLRMAKSDGKPLLDDLTILRLRLANASERERFREVGDGKVVLFLIGLDPE